MNVKAERMEQMIQVINRNLQLIFCGEESGIVPLEVMQLQKVDAVIFGHDKFAFEMVHFVKAAVNTQSAKKSLADLWEENFVQGMESLLVECAVVNDDIERDCFVSRVYCWFTEKLQERRDLPRRMPRVEHLRSNVARLGGEQTHTQRGLEAYERGIEEADTEEKAEQLRAEQTAAFNATDHDQPALHYPEQQSRFGKRTVPAYVKQAFPNVLSGGPADTGGGYGGSARGGSAGGFGQGLPKIPGAEENYGMLYNKPETEAEKAMHELWMARRRQEAFEWKTQQHLALVMDRLALHKSRLESDALRRMESSSMLKQAKAPPAPSDYFRATSAPSRARASTTKGHAPAPPRSADRMFRHAEISGPNSPGRRTRRRGDSPDAEEDRSRSNSENPSANRGNPMPAALRTTLLVMGREGDKEEVIGAPSRTSVRKSSTAKSPMPMRFKIDLPDDYDGEGQKIYMQLSDSDDDDIPDRPAKSLNRRVTGKPAKKKEVKSDVTFKHDRPVDRERPLSAKLFHNVAANNTEFKVHYRHTNYRRMPLTPLQEAWLDDREMQRLKSSEDAVSKLLEGAAAKAAKKTKGDKKEEKKDKDKKAVKPVKGEVERVKNKYASAADFMSAQFPTFEFDDDPSTQGPMRSMQLMEVANIMDVCADAGLNIKESALRKALIIPQDRPEAICLENLRNEKEGLMVNPMPRELWRKMAGAGGGKKKGGKKKK